jgi:hypothetical protein
MPKAVMVVLSSPSDPSREAEYNEWYDNTHLPEVCAIPGFVGARRFKVSDAGLMSVDPAAPAYLAIYELDADDLATTCKELIVRSGDGRVQMSDVLSSNPGPSAILYEALD